jgi:DNA-binding transcriptional LysR family regulator
MCGVEQRGLDNRGEALVIPTRAGIWILLQPEELIRDDLATGNLVEMLPGYREPTGAFHLPYALDHRMTPNLRSFIDFVVSGVGG